MPFSGKKMTDAAISAEVGNRVADWLRRIYPRDGAKLASQEFDVSHHTTRKWFEGARPENKHFDVMVKRWGKLFLDFVYSPLAGQGEPDALTARIAHLQERVERVEASLARGPLYHSTIAVGSDNDAVDASHASDAGIGEAGRRAAAAAAEAEMSEAAQ